MHLSGHLHLLVCLATTNCAFIIALMIKTAMFPQKCPFQILFLISKSETCLHVSKCMMSIILHK